MSQSDFSSVFGARVLLGMFLVGLALASYQVLALFLRPIVWAIILVYLSWPVYRRLRVVFGGWVNSGALVMTLLMTCLFVVPLTWVVVLVRADVPTAYAVIVEFIGQGKEGLSEYTATIPWIGAEVNRLLEVASSDMDALRSQLLQWLQPLADETLSMIGNIGYSVFKFGFTMLTAFFLYVDGESLLQQVRRLLLRLLGSRAGKYLDAIGNTTRAVLYGLVLTALVQGLLAGLGYWLAGLRAPALLGVITVILAIIPFGATGVWATVSLWLLANGDWWTALGLAAWGAVVISQIDNLLRPMLISSATRIPYLFVLFSVLGGVYAFGLIGLFIGPIVIAVLLAVWKEWLEEQAAAD